jgi:hypothetical protein
MGLAALRQHLACTRPVQVTDPQGGITTTLLPLGTAHGQVSARLDMPTFLQTVLGDRAAYLCVLDGRTAPALQVGDRISDATQTYEVVQVVRQGRYMFAWSAAV